MYTAGGLNGKATGHRFEKGELRGLLAVGGAKL